MSESRKSGVLTSDIRTALHACRPHLIAAATFSLGINLLYLALPLYMLQVYDRVLASGSIPTLTMLVLACLIALATLAALDMVRTRVLVRAGLEIDHQFSSSILGAMVQRANYFGPLERGQGMRDLDVLRHAIAGPGMNALFDTPWAPMYIAIIFLIHPLLGAFALGSSVVLLTLAVLNEYVTKRAVTAGNATAARSHLAIEASLRNAELVQALGMLPHVSRKWLGERKPMLSLQTIAAERSAFVSGVIKFARLFTQALVLALGAYLVIDRSITAGAMFAASIILSRALQPVEQLVGSWKQLIAGRDALIRIARLLQERPQPRERLTLPRPRGDLLVQGVSFVVPALPRAVLSNINFALKAGEALAIIGPTAAGKSTLARIIVGVRRPSAGIVRLDGADIAAWPREDLGPCVGYLPQDVELFSGTVADNISRFTPAESGSVVDAAKLAGAHEMILALKNGYETDVGDSGCNLSGGQRQRIALARAVLGKPSLVILDEPNSNLDVEGEAALAACLKGLKQFGATVIIVSHRISVLNNVDKVLQLRGGMVDAFGPRDEVIARFIKPARMPRVQHAQANGS